MGARRRLFFLSAVLMQILMLGATAAPVFDGINPMGNYEKMNTDLKEILDSSEEDLVIPVIFQLHSPVSESDKQQFEAFHAEVLGDAPLVDGGLIEAKIEDIRKISNWESGISRIG